MNIIQRKLEARDVGQIPVSIGTSLALEGAFGIYPDRPASPPPIHSVKRVYINVRTLIRNLINGLDADGKDMVTAEPVFEAVAEEMEIISAAISRQGNAGNSVVFYAPSYVSLNKKFRFAKLWKPSTPRQIALAAIEESVTRQLAKEVRTVAILHMDTDFPGNLPESLLLTHYPVDLLSRYSFKRVDLLESHSGVIKPFSQWYTKLGSSKELTNVPFNRLTLQVFGDGGNHFFAGPNPWKKAVLELAEERNWTPVTSNELVVDSIRRYKDPLIKGQLLSLL